LNCALSMTLKHVQKRRVSTTSESSASGFYNAGPRPQALTVFSALRERRGGPACYRSARDPPPPDHGPPPEQSLCSSSFDAGLPVRLNGSLNSSANSAIALTDSAAFTDFLQNTAVLIGLRFKYFTVLIMTTYYFWTAKGRANSCNCYYVAIKYPSSLLRIGRRLAVIL